MPCVIGRLHAQPRLRTTAEQFADPDGDLRGQRLSLSHDVIELLPRYPEQAGDLGLAPVDILHDVGDQRAGMRRAPVLVSNCFVSRHGTDLLSDIAQSRRWPHRRR